MKAKTENCYYNSYTMCTNKFSSNYNKRCIGNNECEEFISESQYFLDSMSGKIKEQKANQEKEARPVDYQKLTLGKSKKALKREAKIEAEKEGAGSGFSLLDDPRFKDLFKK